MTGTSVATGKVIRFDEIRGYGFVAPDTGTEDVFVHVNDVTFDKRLLTAGTRVRFITEEGDRGLKASRVQIDDQTSATIPVPFTPQSESMPALQMVSAADDELCDILSEAELLAEVTEALVTSIPTLTSEQIVKARACFLRVAGTHGWLEG